LAQKKAEPNGKGGEKPQKQERTEGKGKKEITHSLNIEVLVLVLVFQVGLCFSLVQTSETGEW